MKKIEAYGLAFAEWMNAQRRRAKGRPSTINIGGDETLHNLDLEATREELEELEARYLQHRYGQGYPIPATVTKHYGPGPHQNGSPQSVHGTGTGSRWNEAKMDRLKERIKQGDREAFRTFNRLTRPSPDRNPKPAKPDVSYRGPHQPSANYGAHAYDLSEIVNPDIYDHPEWYFSMSEPYNRIAAFILRRIRGKPEAKVNIYRAVPADAGDTINPGDWVTIVRSYAKLHGESILQRYDDQGNPIGPGYKILKAQVKAKELMWPADSLVEFGWFPEGNVEKHYGPGPHQNGTPQSVHGGSDESNVPPQTGKKEDIEAWLQNEAKRYGFVDGIVVEHRTRGKYVHGSTRGKTISLSGHADGLSGAPETQTPIGVAAHELGHLLFTAAESQYGMVRDAWIAEATFQLGLDDTRHVRDWTHKAQTRIKRQLDSSYALKNHDELFAEAYAVGRLRENPPPLAKGAVDFIDSWLQPQPVTKHYGPGPHPGSGTPQSVHGGDRLSMERLPKVDWSQYGVRHPEIPDRRPDSRWRPVMDESDAEDYFASRGLDTITGVHATSDYAGVVAEGFLPEEVGSGLGVGWGNGLYLVPDDAEDAWISAQQYAQEGVSLHVMAGVKNPLEVWAEDPSEATWIAMQQGGAFAEFHYDGPGVYPLDKYKIIHEWAKIPWDPEWDGEKDSGGFYSQSDKFPGLSKVLMDHGYDALIIHAPRVYPVEFVEEAANGTGADTYDPSWLSAARYTDEENLWPAPGTGGSQAVIFDPQNVVITGKTEFTPPEEAADIERRIDEQAVSKGIKKLPVTDDDIRRVFGPWLYKPDNINKHYGPGPHPRSGTPQSIHGSGAHGASGPQLATEAAQSGGFSVEPVSSRRPTTGYMVAFEGDEERYPISRLTPRLIRSYRRRKWSKLQAPDTFFGAWVDDKGNVVFDVSQQINDLETAKRLQKERHQDAIWDVANMKEIR